MNKKQKVGIPIAVLLAALGGSWAFDFSTTTTTTNIEGDTEINIEQGEDYCKLAREACAEDLIPEKYADVCPIINLVCG